MAPKHRGDRQGATGHFDRLAAAEEAREGATSCPSGTSARGVRATAATECCLPRREHEATQACTAQRSVRGLSDRGQEGAKARWHRSLASRSRAGAHTGPLEALSFTSRREFRRAEAMKIRWLRLPGPRQPGARRPIPPTSDSPPTPKKPRSISCNCAISRQMCLGGACHRSSKFPYPRAQRLKKPTNVGFFALGWK
jgi:hypothetical protein